jgi:protein-L-isoaspartate(D-aspartate) O-methyltransferase
MAELKKQERERMVTEQILARGVRDKQVLDAMRKINRESFVPENLQNLAYEDRPLPIEGGQTISQPYIVAFMIEALALKGGEKVLEIGAGSGYAAAVLAEIAREVFTIERIEKLAENASTNLMNEGYDNVHVLHADGTIGWREESPFDAILVSAGAPEIPLALKKQLSIGGRMVIPVGSDPKAQELIRITRVDENEYDYEDMADVRFVPLIGKEGWELEEGESEITRPRVVQTRPRTSESLISLISDHAETFSALEEASLESLLERIGNARVVLIGEASHGTSEFYKMRALITKRLIEEKNFNIIAAEADWPDAARIDHYVRHRETPPSEWTAFARFPTWMWRNNEVKDFIDWLHEHNSSLPYNKRTGFYGLDLYSLYNSARSVINYLEEFDPDLATVARNRYGCLSPWEADPAAYGHAALSGKYRNCERDVVCMLEDLQKKQMEYAYNDGERFLDASQNARLVANAERYYRVMYYGSRASWNLRDSHMFDTLLNVMEFHGENAKAVVWAHNSHIGDAAATEMSARGEHNIGQLCRKKFLNEAYNIGFGTDHGTVAAASNWDSPMEIKPVRPSHAQSYERLFHLTNEPGLMLPLRSKQKSGLHYQLMKPKLERAIGVVYRPETELASHYFEAVLPNQFDEYIWIDQTEAITPLSTEQLEGFPDTYPFGI